MVCLVLCMKTSNFKFSKKPRNQTSFNDKLKEKPRVYDMANFLINMGCASSFSNALEILSKKSVRLNGAICTDEKTKVYKDDIVELNGKAVNFTKPRIYEIFKPRGYVVKKDAIGDTRSIFSIIPSRLSDLRPIGSADSNMEGLLLFTNHPRLASLMGSPLSGIKKVYKVKLSRQITENEKTTLSEGVTLNLENTFVPIETISVQVDTVTEHASFLTVVCYSASVIDLRKGFFNLDMKISSITRVAYGKFKLRKEVKDSGCLVESREFVSLRELEARVSEKLDALKSLGIVKKPKSTYAKDRSNTYSDDQQGDNVIVKNGEELSDNILSDSSEHVIASEGHETEQASYSEESMSKTHTDEVEDLSKVD